jgi:uncharacterized protein (DUF1810 family)
MWYVFPQIEGLGRSDTAQFYAIEGLDEARKYLDHPHLGARLRECTHVVLDVKGRTLHEIFGSPDDWKFRSSMTLFEFTAPDELIFGEALERYCEGIRDDRTLKILGL